MTSACTAFCIVLMSATFSAQLAAAPPEAAEKTLSDTSSPLPLIALSGVLALGAALTIRTIRKRTL